MSKKQNTEYWNSRGYKRAPLSKDSKLVDRIKHGDFDLSYFQKMIERENKEFSKVEKQVEKAVKGSDKDREDAMGYYRRKHFNRVQHLTERLLVDEQKKLAELRTALNEEFGIDIWEDALEECDGGAMDLYNVYRKRAANK